MYKISQYMNIEQLPQRINSLQVFTPSNHLSFGFLTSYFPPLKEVSLWTV